MGFLKLCMCFGKKEKREIDQGLIVGKQLSLNVPKKKRINVTPNTSITSGTVNK